MADFGWAFVKGNLVTGSAPPSGAIQYNDGNNKFAASGDFVFVSGATSQLNLTGNLDVVGDVSASTFYGDGSNLTGIGSVNIANDGVNRVLTADGDGTMTAESNFTFDGSTLNVTGTLNVSGTINANEININVENRDVINISVTGSTKFGDSSDDTHVFTGSMYVGTSISSSTIYGTVISASTMNLTGIQAGTPPNTSSYLALDSNYNLVLTSAAGEVGSDGTIGEAEDGTYADGLFSDFTPETPIGTAIDKINEILKTIVPGPAPAVDRINYTNIDGLELVLAFQEPSQSESIGYTVVGTTGSFTTVLQNNDQYTVATSGEDFRLGVYDGSQEITGVINFNVVEQLKTNEINYSHDAFGNAESGSLNLYLNGTLLRTLDLNGFAGAGNPNTGSATDLNSSGSGFFDISVSASATDQNGSEYDIFQHRTAKYVIDPQDQNKGWNYAKIEHQYGTLTYTTNFVQWVNDTDASASPLVVIAAPPPSITFTGNGSKYLSGVQYFRSASLDYVASAGNFYANTYPTGNVLTFNTSLNLDNISPSGAAAADVGLSSIFSIAASTDTIDDVILNDSATISFNLSHPLKTNLTTAGSVTTSEILIYNIDTASSNTDENFDIEDYRLQDGAYSTQASASDSSNAWDSREHMVASGDAGHASGLLMYNGSLRSPLQGANGGDFGGLSNGPGGNPDYSAITGTRTFFRKIRNTLAQSVRDLRITSTKSSRVDDETLSTNNIRFEVKIPGSTGWMDISQNFSYGNTDDDDGALISGASLNSQTAESATGDAVHCVTFGTQSVSNGEHIVVRIKADESWTGNIDRLQFKLRATADATDPTEAPALDDIDSSNNGNDNSKLSFGTSNPIDGFVNVEGDGTGSMEDIDSNSIYRNFGDRRGVFSSKPTLIGTLNQDVNASGNNYPDNSFYNAYTGSLILEVNGTEVHEVSLTSSLNSVSNDFNGNSSGFSFSAVSFSETSDSIPDYTKPYRTGDYQIGANDQNVGWNYARVIHRTNSDQVTNYVEWVVDTSSSVDTSISSPDLTNFGHTDVYYQSGIGYFASNPTASFSFSGSNFYNNVYQNGNAISFPGTSNITIESVTGSGPNLTTLTGTDTELAMPSLDNSADCELTDVVVTASVYFNASTSISGGLGIFTSRDAEISGKIIHPLKTDRTTTLSSKTDFMRHSGSLGSTTLTADEYFGLETYRIVSGNYLNQAAVTSSSNTWNSSTAMNNGGAHDDGMVTINGYAISPLQIGNSGDTRNVDDGGSLQAPPSNPDYSTLSEDIRTYYRYFYNNTGTNLASITLTLYGDAELVSKEVGDTYYAALGANKNINVEVKSPTKPDDDPDQSTGWGDAARAWASALQPTPANDGAGIRDIGGGDEQTIGSAGLGVNLTFGNRRISAGSYYVVKISAHKDWTGYISRINIS